MTEPLDPMARADLALACLSVDPLGLGGLWLRARSGPARDHVVAGLSALPLPLRKIHPSIGDSQLFGGVDLSATLSSGHLVKDPGLLATPATLVLTMAERCPPGLPARLGQALDDRRTCLIALDEGAEPDEVLAASLAERLAFFVPLDGVRHVQARMDHSTENGADRDNTHKADALADVTFPDGLLAELTMVAAQLGIASLRAPLFALRAARALAVLDGRTEVQASDILTAVDLTLAHRATVFPSAEDMVSEDPPPPPPEAENETDSPESDTDSDINQLPPMDVVLEAALAALPPDVLAQLADSRAKSRAASGSGSGNRKRGNRRGRPLPSRPGRLDGRARIDIVATLRAAAPWQTIRDLQSPRTNGLHIRPADIRLKRFEDRSDRLLIFAVDASGSSAMARLAEAKGAVELLLAEAYARRDHVALVAFRGNSAELLLPPTRSLVQTKRRLAALPGGGGTPLAAGLRAAQDTALHATRHGLTPSVVLLTDGRGNIALDGTANRAQAADDAEAAGRALGAMGLASLVVDTANRPQQALKSLSGAMGGTYLALPRANAERLSQAVSTALED